MKIVLLSTMATVATVALWSPTFAADITHADWALLTASSVELWGGGTFITGGSAHAPTGLKGKYATYGSFGGVARTSIALHRNVSAQFDFEAELNPIGVITVEGLSSEQYSGSFIAGAHLSRRDASSLYGIFGGVGSVMMNNNGSAPMGFVGAEAQWYHGPNTFYGQVGYMTTGADDEGVDGLHNAGFVRGVWRYFPNDNSMWQGELSYAQGLADKEDQSANAFGWGVRYEKKHSSLPFSLFAAYQGGYYSKIALPADQVTPEAAWENGHYFEHVFLVGVKFQFGAPNAMANDRLGATLDLPHFGRWSGSGKTYD